MIKLTVQGMWGAGAIADAGLLGAIGRLNFLYASGWLFLISIAIIVGASLTAPAPSAAQIEGLTYGSMTPEQKRENRESWDGRDVAASIGVMALVLGIYVYFSFWL
jgi:SSS family solute:Na+ symporter